MLRRLLAIVKKPEFDARGEVVLGQCEPFSSGWNLLLYPPLDRQEAPTGYGPPQKLLSGVYGDLRKIQEACAGIDEVEAVRKRAAEMKALLTSSVIGAVAADLAARHEDAADSTKILEPTKTDLMPADPVAAQDETVLLEPPTGKEDFFALRTQDGAVIATVGGCLDEVSVLKAKLAALLESEPRALVVDLERLPNLAAQAARDLLAVRDDCRKRNISFALCGVRKSVRRLLVSLVEERDIPAMHPTAAEALDSLNAGTPKET